MLILLSSLWAALLYMWSLGTTGAFWRTTPARVAPVPTDIADLLTVVEQIGVQPVLVHVLALLGAAVLAGLTSRLPPTHPAVSWLTDLIVGSALIVTALQFRPLVAAAPGILGPAATVYCSPRRST